MAPQAGVTREPGAAAMAESGSLRTVSHDETNVDAI